jgi:hypothetical protein
MLTMNSKNKVSQVLNNIPQRSLLRGGPKNICISVQILINAKLLIRKEVKNRADREKDIKEARYKLDLVLLKKKICISLKYLVLYIIVPIDGVNITSCSHFDGIRPIVLIVN